MFCEAVVNHLRTAGLTPRTIGVNDFSNEAPVAAVRQRMELCHGAVVLGLTQMEVHEGARKRGTARAEAMRSQRLPTAWNQLEAGMAYALRLPTFIVREVGLEPDGIFDTGVGDRFVHQTDLGVAWLDSEQFVQPFRQWVAEVLDQAGNT